MQTQETAIATLQATRNVELNKQAQAEAELQILQASMDKKVTSYQTTVAQRAKEASSFNNWNKSNDAYVKALEGVVKFMSDKRKKLGDANTSSTNLAPVQGVLEGMKFEVVNKQKDLTTKHEGQDADYLTLVTSYRKALADSEATFSSKRVQKETAQIAARDAGAERDVRRDIKKGESSVLEVLIHLCAKNSGKVPRTISEGDVLLSAVNSRVSSTSTSLNAMPDVGTSFLAERVVTPASDAAARIDEMKRLAAQVKNRQQANQLRTFVGHRNRTTARKLVIAKPHPKPLPVPVATIVSGSKSARNASAVRVLDPSVARFATSAVAVRKLKTESTPATLDQCVKEKQRIAADITVERANKQEAETQKKLAETVDASLTKQIAMVNDQKTKLTDAYNGFSSKWMPLMTSIGTNDYSKDLSAAMQKVDGIKTDVNTYTALSGAPPAAAALPTALDNVKTSIGNLRDDVQKDLTNLESLFTGSLMVVYPAETNRLSKQASDLEAKKAQAAKDVKTATQAVSTSTAKVDQLKKEWDMVEAQCAPLLKGK